MSLLSTCTETGTSLARGISHHIPILVANNFQCLSEVILWFLYMLHTHQLMEQIYSTTVMLPSMAHPTSKGDDGRGGFDHEGGPPWDSVWNIHWSLS